MLKTEPFYTMPIDKHTHTYMPVFFSLSRLLFYFGARLLLQTLSVMLARIALCAISRVFDWSEKGKRGKEKERTDVTSEKVV